MSIAKFIDHTALSPMLTDADVEQLCAEAIKHQFASVCIPPSFVTLASKLLKGSKISVTTVIGFPFGYSTTEAKVAEIKQALKDGADELDMVINLGDIKMANYEAISKELAACLLPIRSADKILKVIIESGMLTDLELIDVCNVCAKHHVDYVKTSTGYATAGASVHAVQVMRETLPPEIKIKASGGIRDYTFANELQKAGADRIGASAGIKIVQHESK